MTIFCDVIPKTNAERLEEWLDKDGPLRHFEERWPGVPFDVAHAIEHCEYVAIHNSLRRQAE
jgi:hypothetical protein